MNVVFDQQIFEHQEYGGISRYAYELALSISTSSDTTVSIVSPVYVNYYLRECVNSGLVKGMWLPKLPRTARIYRGVNLLISKILIRCIRPNIIHQTYYTDRAVSYSKSKIILTVHDMIHEKFPQNFSKNDQTSQLKKIAVNRADHIICVSENTRRDLIEIYKIDPAKTSVVYLGLSLPKILGNMEVKVRDKPFLLYVGNRAGYKNFNGLLVAYSSSRFLKSTFDLVCFGGGDFTDEELVNMKRLGIDHGHVIHVSGGDALLANYYAQAHVFIYPSLYEGFGIPPLEAMSLRCPVVCSNVSSIPEVVGGAAYMFDPYDSEKIRVAVEAVVRDATLRNDLIQRGIERANFFSWRKCADETYAIYERVAV